MSGSFAAQTPAVPAAAAPDHSVARPATVAGCVAEFIACQGVTRVFSLPGGHMKPIWDELPRAGVRIVTARHEVAAVHMAQAEADLGGGLAVAIVTTGPGLTNAVTGIASAYLAGSPMLVISTSPPRPQAGMGALEEVDQASIVAPICRGVEVIADARHVPARLDRAVSLALGDDGAPGPVYIEFPVDLLREPMLPAYAGTNVFRPRMRAPRPPDQDAVERVAELVRACRRPLVISGRDGVLEPEALREFVQLTGALYLDSRASRGSVSESISTYVPARRARAMAEADLVITLGRMLDFELAYGSPAIFQTARFARIGRTFADTAGNRRADAEIRADVGPSLRALLASDCAPADPDQVWLNEMLVENKERVTRLREVLSAEKYGPDQRIHPNALLAAMNDFIDDETIVVVDGGDILSFARSALRAPTYLDLGAFGCLGVGTPFAVSASISHPDRRVVAVIGDGAFGFNAMEVETAVREGAKPVLVVANNGAFNIERYDQLVHYGGRIIGTELSDCAFDQLARALGAHGERVEREEELRPALERAFSTAPALIDVAVTRDAVSSDSKSGLASVRPLQALANWDVAEREWLAVQTKSKRWKMSVSTHHPDTREAPRGYSEATSGAGLVAVSGQMPSEEVLARSAPFDEQFVSALQRFVETAESAGASASDILLMRIYVTSASEYKDGLRSFGSTYRDTFFGRYPATTLVEVSGLIDERARVEIEGLAIQARF